MRYPAKSALAAWFWLSASAPLAAVSDTIVIQQVEADAPIGGAESGHEWFEIRNVGYTTRHVHGWSLADNSATDTIPDLTLLAGCSAIVAADAATFLTNHPAHTGAVVTLGGTVGNGLSNTGDRLILSDATLSTVDCMSYGDDTACLSPAAPLDPSNQTLQRVPAGVDTDSSADWVLAAEALPEDCSDILFRDGFESSDTTAWQEYPCGVVTVANETDLPLELDYCAIQFPFVLNSTVGVPTAPVFGQVFEAGVTSVPGPAGNVRAQLGFGPTGTNPTVPAELCSWTFVSAPFNIQVGNNDEYQAALTVYSPGTYSYAYRFSLDGLRWTFCDDDGAGSNPGLVFSAADLGVLTVTP